MSFENRISLYIRKIDPLTFGFALIVGTRLSLVKYDNTPALVKVKDGDYLDAPKRRNRFFINEMLLTYLIFLIIIGLTAAVFLSII